MPSSKEKEAAEKARKDQLDKLKIIVEQMKKPDPTAIRLTGGVTIQLTEEVLNTFASGGRYYKDIWKVLWEMLISKRWPNTVLLIGSSEIPQLQRGQVAMLLCQDSMCHSPHQCPMFWFLVIIQGFNREVEIRRVGRTRECELLEDVIGTAEIAKAVGVSEYELILKISQVT